MDPDLLRELDAAIRAIPSDAYVRRTTTRKFHMLGAQHGSVIWIASRIWRECCRAADVLGVSAPMPEMFSSQDELAHAWIARCLSRAEHWRRVAEREYLAQVQSARPSLRARRIP
jgi:hypothetical protein